MKRHPAHLTRHRLPQRGMVLVFALITLVILLIGAVAISRSITSSQLVIGNIGFKRDLTNQGERALQIAMDAVRSTGVLATDAARNANLQSANYSASLLATNSQGIPTALLSDTQFAAVGTADQDIKVEGMGVTIRYVIDRMATKEGACSSKICTMVSQKVPGSASNDQGKGLSTPEQPIFRITLRVSGPRKTLSFFQSTFTAD
jgi:type IV pilus assembly protein PilX